MADDMAVESIDLRTHPGEKEFRVGEIAKRKAHLISKGFSSEWVDHLAASRPTLYNPQIVDQHLNLLKELGFENPQKMITTLPTIFAYAEENIRKRISLLSRLIKLYDLPLSPISLMEKEFYLFSTKLDKIWVPARIIREYKIQPQELSGRLIGILLQSNLENTLIAFNESDPKTEKIDDFLRKLRQINKEKVSKEGKETKREIIQKELQTFDKIKRRYLRGYPIKPA